MRNTLCATALVALALLGAGCKKASPIVGKWNATESAGTVEMEFKPDNTFTLSSKAAQFGVTAKGDYKLDGEKLSLTTKDIDAPGLPPALLAKAKQSPDFSKPKDVTVKFTGDDEVSMSGLQANGAPGQEHALTLKRVKEGS